MDPKLLPVGWGQWGPVPRSWELCVAPSLPRARNRFCGGGSYLEARLGHLWGWRAQGWEAGVWVLALP